MIQKFLKQQRLRERKVIHAKEFLPLLMGETAFWCLRTTFFFKSLFLPKTFMHAVKCQCWSKCQSSNCLNPVIFLIIPHSLFITMQTYLLSKVQLPLNYYLDSYSELHSCTFWCFTVWWQLNQMSKNHLCQSRNNA